MADGGVSLAGLVMVAAGGVLAYAGVNDPVGGPVGVVSDILQGRTPTPQLRSIDGGGAALGSAVAGAVATGSRAAIIAVAKSYLGTPYFLGGASHRGIDCSGLVLVAYRDGAGISLPHKATLQAARGRRIPREQLAPADLVAWGVPGNYPHIALAVDANTVIVAPSWGKPVQYQPLWERKVPGFGYPDIIRILG